MYICRIKHTISVLPYALFVLITVSFCFMPTLWTVYLCTLAYSDIYAPPVRHYETLSFLYTMVPLSLNFLLPFFPYFLSFFHLMLTLYSLLSKNGIYHFHEIGSRAIIFTGCLPRICLIYLGMIDTITAYCSALCRKTSKGVRCFGWA